MSATPVNLLTQEQVEAAVAAVMRRELGNLLRDTVRPPSNILTEKEAAAYLAQSPNTLRHWRKDSRGPAYLKDCRGIRYDKRDLDAWLRSNRTTTSEDPDVPHRR